MYFSGEPGDYFVMYVCIHIQIYMFICVYIYICRYIYVYIYIYIYLYTYTLSYMYPLSYIYLYCIHIQAGQRGGKQHPGLQQPLLWITMSGAGDNI